MKMSEPMEVDDMEMYIPIRPNYPLRRAYRELLDETQKLGLKDPDVLAKSFAEGGKLFESVKHPREAMYDAQLVHMQSHIVKQRTEALHSCDFDPEEYGRNVISMYRRQKVTASKVWRELGRESKTAMTTSPAFHFMYGTFEPGAVELKRKVRKGREKDVLGKIQKPNLIQTDPSKDCQSSTEVERVFSILTSLCQKQDSSVSYFEFVVNPHSFAETIENMFHVAILVKEGAARIFLDADQHPFIDPLPGFKQQTARVHGHSNQAIYSITMEDWQKLIKKFHITKPRIPPRVRNT